MERLARRPALRLGAGARLPRRISRNVRTDARNRCWKRPKGQDSARQKSPASF